ncbi:MAG TPA: arsenate reductase ArsC [bacterium]
MNNKPKVLVICTGNSMRSQLAEAVLRHELGDRIDVASAGVSPGRIYPLVIDVLRDVGIDASGQYSKSVDQFLHERMDLVITVCDHANEVCPIFPNAVKRVHRGYPDPIRLAMNADEYQVFSDLRDRIKAELVPLVIRELDLH